MRVLALGLARFRSLPSNLLRTHTMVDKVDSSNLERSSHPWTSLLRTSSESPPVPAKALEDRLVRQSSAKLRFEGLHARHNLQDTRQ